MATRSTIAIENADGTVEQIYCHWDGYLDHNGKILLNHYQDRSKVQQLIELGDLSSLDAEIDDCVFYGRDKGEDNVKARRFDNYDDYIVNAQTEEFDYILRNDGKWYWNVGYHGSVVGSVLEMF